MALGYPHFKDTSIFWSLVDLATLEATALLLYDLRKGSTGGVAAEHEHALTAAVTAICRGALQGGTPQPPVMFAGL